MEEYCEKVVKFKVSQCDYHFGGEQSYSLVKKHCCEMGELPNVFLGKIQYKSEIWHVEISPNGKYLATVSNKTYLMIWLITKSKTAPFLKFSPNLKWQFEKDVH